MTTRRNIVFFVLRKTWYSDNIMKVFMHKKLEKKTKTSKERSKVWYPTSPSIFRFWMRIMAVIIWNLKRYSLYCHVVHDMTLKRLKIKHICLRTSYINFPKLVVFASCQNSVECANIHPDITHLVHEKRETLAIIGSKLEIAPIHLQTISC